MKRDSFLDKGLNLLESGESAVHRLRELIHDFMCFNLFVVPWT